jgi:hypothetical protein
MTLRFYGLWLVTLLTFSAAGCGDDDSSNEAQRRGVGAACASAMECTEEGQSCLQFKGGYCGIADCKSDRECPEGSACVTHDDGKNYCFLVCTDKPQCNGQRPLESEANCSANVTFVDGTNNRKACVPPSS